MYNGTMMDLRLWHPGKFVSCTGQKDLASPGLSKMESPFSKDRWSIFKTALTNTNINPPGARSNQSNHFILPTPCPGGLIHADIMRPGNLETKPKKKAIIKPVSRYYALLIMPEQAMED
jgi:hypothetical protein